MPPGGRGQAPPLLRGPPPLHGRDRARKRLMEAGLGQAAGGERRESAGTPWVGAELGWQGRTVAGCFQSWGRAPPVQPTAIPASHRDPCRSSFPGSPPTGFPSGLATGRHQRASGLRRREARAFVPLPLSCVASPPRVQPWALLAPAPRPEALGCCYPLVPGRLLFQLIRNSSLP